MIRKLGLSLAIAGLMLAAVPALANAASITSSPTVLAPVNSAVALTDNGPTNPYTLQSSTLGPIRCERFQMTEKLTRNDGTIFEATNLNGSLPGSMCINATRPVTYESFVVSKLASTGAGSGMASFKTELTVSGLHCVYTGTNVPFTYTSGASVIVFSSAGGITGSPAACGTATLSAAFTASISGAAVTFD